MKVYELIQELADYDATDIVEINLPGNNSFDIEGVRTSGWGGTLVIDVKCDESKLAELYKEEEE